MRPTWIVAGVLVVCTACDSGTPDTVPETPGNTPTNAPQVPSTSLSEVGSIDGPVLTSRPPPQNGFDGMAAIVDGRLRMVEGCLLLERGESSYPVVWPFGTTWLGERSAVVLPDGAVAEPGALVSGGGGFLQDVSHLAGSAVNEVAMTCADSTGQIAIFNVGSDVEIVAP